MPGMYMPDGMADEMEKRKRLEAAAQHLRIQIAAAVMPQLLAIDYGTALRVAMEKGELYGTSPDQVEFRVNVNHSVGLAIHAANSLLAALGVIEAPSQEGQ